MTASTHVYDPPDSVDVTMVEDVQHDTSAGLNVDDEEVLSMYSTDYVRTRSRTRCFWFSVLFAAIAIAATVTALILRPHAKHATGSSSGPILSGSGSNDTSTPGNLPPVPQGPVRTHKLSVVEALPHDSNAFTEGFLYDLQREVFFESTGLTGGKSSVRMVNITSGEVLKLAKLPSDSLFGEGISIHGSSRLIMLTWQSHRGFVFDQETLELQNEWKFTGEGWGLTIDPQAQLLYMSDGTNSIRVLNPDTLVETRRFAVTKDGEPVKNLNELEWVCGELWANVWLTKNIVRIDPATGIVRSIIIVDNLPRPEDAQAQIDVLNGIAFDSREFRLWVTGKLWPKVYQVTVDDETLQTQCRQ